jgi:hypothetical protein
MNIVGDSYTLPNRRASAARSVNLYLEGMESPANTAAVLVGFPGLRAVSYVGGECRGAIESKGRVFAVFGTGVYELLADGTTTFRGALDTSTGPVSMAEGTLQVVIVTGASGYVFRLSTNAFSKITDPDWLGSNTVAYLNGKFIFHKPGTQVWYYSAIDDATDLDALEFASAEAAPDDLVAIATDHQEVRLFGTKTTEVWFDAAAADFVFQRNSGATSSVGCLAYGSVKRIDNSLVWLGRDENGAGVVYRAQSYVAQRISTDAVEAELRTSTDPSSASAFTMSVGGKMFYILQAPGLETAWAYEVSTGKWCELGENAGDDKWNPWRGAAHVYAFGQNYVFGTDGCVYRVDPDFGSFGSTPIVYERRAPDTIKPLMMRRSFGPFVLEVEARGVPQVDNPQLELSWSDDGGYEFGNPLMRSVGAIGERPARMIFARTGSGRDRVWRVRYSGGTPFCIIAGGTGG